MSLTISSPAKPILVRFIGSATWTTSCVYPRKRVLKAAKNKLHQALLGPDQSADEILPWANSYLGHFGHADAYNLRKKFCQTLSQHDCHHSMSIAGDFSSIKNLHTQHERRHIASRSIMEEVLMEDVLMHDTLMDDLNG